MPFCSCLPCFKDNDTRHSTEGDPEEPIPARKIIDSSNGSPAKATTNAATPSDAVTFKKENSLPNDHFHSAPVFTYNNEKPNIVNTTHTNNAVSFNNDRRPEPNTTSATESNVAALKNREPTEPNPEPVELDSTNIDSSPKMADQLKSAASGVSDTVSSGAQQAGSAASSGAEKATGGTTGTQDWEAMSEEQKKATYDALPEDQKKMGYYEVRILTDQEG